MYRETAAGGGFKITEPGNSLEIGKSRTKKKKYLRATLSVKTANSRVKETASLYITQHIFCHQMAL